jgi:hypothetical protein
MNCTGDIGVGTVQAYITGESARSVKSEVFTAVNMKNAVIWDVKIQFVPHRRHYVSTTETSQLMLCKI